MNEFLAAVLIFVCLMATALGCQTFHKRLPARHRDDETHGVIKLTAGVFVVTTSLILGLLINSSKSKFEATDATLHAYATEMILMDRSLRRYGPETAETRQRLQVYLKRVMVTIWSSGSDALVDDASERLLNDVESALNVLKATDGERGELWQHAKAHLMRIIELRWTIVGNAHSEIPRPLLIMMVGWLMLIFASFAFRAPINPVTIAMFAASGLLISSSLYLTMDMDTPFSGPMQISPEPLQRALEVMQR